MPAHGDVFLLKFGKNKNFTGEMNLCALCSAIYRRKKAVHRLFTLLVPENGQFVDKSVDDVDNSGPNRKPRHIQELIFD